jgi:predicted lysophospholipase L1 biosynthesis ABC-type transport system permease subunit
VRWGEYALVASAVALIVAALVAQRAVTTSADGAIHDLAHRLGSNMLVLPREQDVADFHLQRYGSSVLADASPAILKSSEISSDIRGTQARLYGHVSLRGQDVLLVGEEGNWPRSPVVGTAPALVSPSAASRLGLRPGSVIELTGAQLSVAGVMERPPDGLEEGILVPLVTAQQILGKPGAINALRLAGCWCRIDVAALGSEVERILPGSRAITVAGVVKAQKGAVATMGRYGLALLVVGALAVAGLVAALVAAQARRARRDLGLLAAIGVSPSVVAALFIASAALSGIAGGLTGYVAAIPATRWLSARTLGAAVSPSLDLFAFAVAGAGLVAAGAAALATRRAVALDPSEVLRES